MAYGFFDSQNGDRKYNSEDFRKLVKILATNGIDYESDGGGFKVSARSPNAMSVAVAGGKAIINGGWIDVGTITNLSISASSSTYARYDAVVVEFNSTNAVRAITIKVLTGTASGTPTYPTLTQTDTVYQMPLAYVYVGANASSIGDNNITDARDMWLSTNDVEHLKESWIATTESLGAIKVGETLNIDEDGTLNANIASQSDVGMVRAGSTMNISPDGEINANIASTSSLGLIKVGDGLRIMPDGTLSTRGGGGGGADLDELYTEMATGKLGISSNLAIDNDDSHLLINDEGDWLSFKQTILFNFA